MTSSAPGDEVTLDDVVARVRELPTRFRSLYVETERRTDERWARVVSNHAHGVLVHGPDPSKEPERRSSMTSRSWMALGDDAWRHKFRAMGVQPTRWRNEAHFEWAHGAVEDVVMGHDGGVAWSGESGTVEHSMSHGRSLRDWWVLNHLWVDAPVERELLGATRDVLGRACAGVRIRSGPGRFRMWSPGPFIGGEHVLSIDIATGMTLAIRSSGDGIEYEQHDVVALEVDPEIDASLTRPPAGAQPREQPPRYDSEAELAATLDDFTLLAPTRLPEAYQFQLGYRDDTTDGAMQATIVYTLDQRRPIRVHQSVAAPGPLPDVDGWVRVERADRAVLMSDETEAEGTRLAATSIGGTYVFMIADLAADELLDVVFSLEPV